MMDLLIKNVRIVETGATSDPVDILIEKGIIQAIGQNLAASKNTQVWDFENAHVSPGFVDVGTQVCEPGFEHREDFESATAAAAAGGFSTLVCFPNTNPTLHSKSEIRYVLTKTADCRVRFLPVGAVSQNCEGKDLAELFDMHAAGAIAFSDGSKSVQDAGLMYRALKYAQAFNGLIINAPHHKTMAAGGQMHEGLMSTQLGLKGIPSLAEELMVQRDLSLLEYAGGQLHLHCLSSKKSVAMVRAAKKSGLAVSADVAVANLCFTDEKLENFDSNWKIQPPLRGEDDRRALVEGLKDGTIDFICSNHSPHDSEAKNLEFPYADFGMIGLETAFALCRTFLSKKLTINDLIEKWAVQPRRILGLEIPKIEVGAAADLTVFDPDLEWVFSENQVRSKSLNSPFFREKLRGKVLGVVKNSN